MNFFQDVWNGATSVAGIVLEGVKELANSLTNMTLYHSQSELSSANFQMELRRLEIARQNATERIIADWALQQERQEFTQLMEARQQEFKLKELKLQWLNQYKLQKEAQTFEYEEGRRCHQEAIELANLTLENQQKLEKFRQEWEDIRLKKYQDFELQLVQARQEHEYNLRKYDRETMLLQASVQLKNTMLSSEYNRILDNHPLISYCTPTLTYYKNLEISKPIPLLVIISPPAVEFEKYPHAGQGFARIETQLTDRLRSFLQDRQHYSIDSTIRPTKFLGGNWDTKRLHGEGAIEILYYTHKSIPTVVLESKVDGDFINIYVASWDIINTHYQYRKIISIPWREAIYPLARENARCWRETRKQLLNEGKSLQEVAEEGGDDEKNLKILEAEERDRLQGRNKRRDYLINDDEYTEELAGFISNIHCILAGLLADQYHLFNNDAPPLLPLLLPNLLLKINEQSLKDKLFNGIISIYGDIYRKIKLINPHRLPNLALDFAIALTELDEQIWTRKQMNYALLAWLELREENLIIESEHLKDNNPQTQIELTHKLLDLLAAVIITADREFASKLNQCLTALGENPFSIADACLERGMKRLQASEYNLAIADFEQVIQMHPDKAQAYYERGLAYLKLKQLDLAISDLTRTLEIQFNDAKTWRDRAKAYNQLGNRATGVNDLDKALEHYEQAVRDYNQAIALGATHLAEKRDEVTDKIDGIYQQQEKVKKTRQEQQDQTQTKAQEQQERTKGEEKEREEEAEISFEAGIQALENKNFQQAISYFKQALKYGHPDATAKLEETQHLQKLSSLIIELGTGIILKLVEIPGGELLIKDGKKTYSINIPTFLMGKYTVTQAQWRQVAKMEVVKIPLPTNPSKFKGDNLPVESITWYEAKEFCDRLKRYTGGRKFRLPSSTEWQYACRAGMKTDYYFDSDNCNQINRYAWHLDNSYNRTHPVGQKQPNAWELYDMHGNVWEWCADHWPSSYQGTPSEGSPWLSGDDASDRLICGGSWLSNSGECNATSCSSRSPDNRNLGNVGLRVVCTMDNS